MARQENRRLAPDGRPRVLAQDTLRLARAGAAVTAEVARRVRRYAWPSTAGRPNRGYLRDRLVALPLLAVVAFGALGWAYAGARGDSAYLRDRAAPALVDLADARASLLIAQGEAERNLDEGRAAELSGLSDRYRTRIARATQSLNQVTRSGALTVAEEQELRVVSALVVDYTSRIGRAQGHAGDPVLRDAELSYARSMLCSQATVATRGNPYPECPAATGSAATSIVDRVTGLEGRLRERLADRAAWGAGGITAVVVAALALGLLAAGLWRTVAFLRRRFRIRLSIPLAAAALPLLTVPFLTADALLALHAQHETVLGANVLAERTSPTIEMIAEERPFSGPNPRAVETLRARIDEDLADGRLAALDGIAPFVFPAGLLAAAVIAGTLHGYRREYLVVTRPGAVA
ncbi:hypothetical protein [Streptomyces griseorubiginosus]|uniref:hypothetical protein n=1 Tax=Streptomyces griseorubiginosus TaxID=67304 RepID=UPI002E80A655|nr:hypothetical protein [Streptomyces griseorubiginosus]WUB48990.1 hypothetical protein OHN19_38875 [Streptomyces griseorubiginosus]WUB57517.1 hypothetical protein OG942_38885 [Streptomyces griseorubiginosus]